MILPASDGQNRKQDQEDDHHDHQQTNHFSRIAGHPFRWPRRTSLAGEVNESQTFKRFQGLSFEAGQKHGVGYFYDNAGSCKLVLTLADASTESLTAIRYERAVPVGQITRYTSEGHSFEFGCQAEIEPVRTLRTGSSADESRPRFWGPH
jgi:hypothetical protein